MNPYRKCLLVRNLAMKDVLLCTYLWCEKVGFSAIARMTGISRKAISSIIADIQQAMLTECLEHPPTMGGPGKIVEIDETEVGVRRKGVKGRPANIKMEQARNMMVWWCTPTL